jgi:NTP pyrophosphatase (non-canonical NTP hydrolase)
MQGLFVKDGTDPLSHCALGLAGESGEIADLVKKSQYEGATDASVSRLMEECGDVLWYLTHIAGLFGFSLEELAGMNIEKLAARRPAQYAAYVNMR